MYVEIIIRDYYNFFDSLQETNGQVIYSTGSGKH